MELTETQKEVLSKMEIGKQYSAYYLQCSIATLRALRSEGFVKCLHRGGGSIFMPRNINLYEKIKK